MAVDVALPYRTDWREMQNVLGYCKGKGADRAVLESRFGGGESLRETLNALEQLEMIVRNEAGDVRLTPAGEQLAYAPDAEQRRTRLTEALVGYAPYRFPLERAVADGAGQLDAPWVEHIWQVDMRLAQPRNRTEEARTCFFRLADEAGLGTYRRGVRGQTTRLDLADDFIDRLRPHLDRLRQRDVRRLAVDDPSEASVLETGDAPAAALASGASDGDVPSTSGSATEARPLAIMPAPSSTPASPAPSSSTSITMYVDMTSWDLDRIERFLALIGYRPDAAEMRLGDVSGTSP